MNSRTLLRQRTQDQSIDQRIDQRIDQHIRQPPGSARPGSARPRGEAAKPARGHGATWTSERVAALKSCIDAGLTCSQIAAEIGVSRNAVIGKMSRLGLSREKPPRARAASPKPAARFRSLSLARLLARSQVTVAPPLQPSASPITILDGRGCSLLDLRPGQCRWPINEPGAADFHFCGSAQVESLPYCLGHARLAYKSTAGSA